MTDYDADGLYEVSDEGIIYVDHFVGEEDNDSNVLDLDKPTPKRKTRKDKGRPLSASAEQLREMEDIMVIHDFRITSTQLKRESKSKASPRTLRRYMRTIISRRNILSLALAVSNQNTHSITLVP